MCDIFAPTSLDSLVRHCFYYTTVEAIEENIFSFTHSLNKHLMSTCSVLYQRLGTQR